MAFVALLIVTFAAGVAYRHARGNAAAWQRKRDRQADRVLPAAWEQLADLDMLARRVADRDGRAPDHVLAQYGAFTYNGGRQRGMTRRALSRADAERVIRDIQHREGVTLETATFEEWRTRNAPDHSDEIPF